MSNFPAGGPQGPPAPKDYPLAQASPVLLQPTIATGGPVTASPYTTANAPFAQPGGAYAQQYPYSSTSQYSSQTQYSHVVPPGMETRLPIEAAMSGRWRYVEFHNNFFSQKRIQNTRLEAFMWKQIMVE